MRFKKVKLPNGNTIIDTGLPQRAMKPAGLEMHTHMLKQLFNSIGDNQKMRDGSIKRTCNFLINTIFDMAKRDEAIENIHMRVADVLGDDGGASLNFGERMMIESEVWLDIAVKVFVEYLDQVFAVTHRLAIGTFGNASDTPYMEEPELEPAADINEEWKEPMDDA